MSVSAPSLVLENARLAADAEPRAVEISDGVVTDLDAHPDAVARTLDLDGRFLLPGLWDHHVHADQHALGQGWIDLAPARDAREVVALVRAHLDAGKAVAGEPIVGTGYRDGLWPAPPRRELLDEITADVPIVLIGGDLHQAWLNRAGLVKYGLDPDGDGVVTEDAWHPIMTDVRDVPAEVLDRWVLEAAEDAASRGIVGIIDFEKADTRAHWTRRIAAGGDRLRVVAAIWPEFLDAALASGLRTGDIVDGTRGLLEVGSLKVVTDGSLNTRTAFCDDPYPAGGHGMLVVPPDELEPLMARAAAGGLDSAIHAIGDHANALALDAFARTGARGVIEHAQLVRTDDLMRFAELGVGASVQPMHAVDDRDVADEYWPDRTGRAFAYRSLAEAGVRLTFGSDAPVAPLDPFVTMAAAVGRTTPDREAWHPEQRLDLAAALLASTWSGARPLAVGVPADLVVVDGLSDDIGKLARTPVAGTMVAGRWTWQDGI